MCRSKEGPGVEKGGINLTIVEVNGEGKCWTILTWLTGTTSDDERVRRHTIWSFLENGLVLAAHNIDFQSPWRNPVGGQSCKLLAWKLTRVPKREELKTYLVETGCTSNDIWARQFYARSNRKSVWTWSEWTGPLDPPLTGINVPEILACWLWAIILNAMTRTVHVQCGLVTMSEKSNRLPAFYTGTRQS